MSTEDLLAEVASLPIDERALIADRILRSLNAPDAELEQRWAELAEHRLAELRSGDVQGIPGEEVLAKVWKRFGT